MKFTGTLPDVAPRPVVKKFMNGHWQFPEQMGASDKLGFIYVVRDNYLKRFYLGKKHFRGLGKVNSDKESNWKTYRSSSKTLEEHFKFRPIEEFEFICLEQYETKGTLSYSETWSLCLVEVPMTKTWYNTLIPEVSWSCREEITQRHKDRLKKVMRMEKMEE